MIRFLAALASLALLCTALAACEDSTPPGNNPPPANPKPTPVTPPDDATTPPATDPGEGG